MKPMSAEVLASSVPSGRMSTVTYTVVLRGETDVLYTDVVPVGRPTDMTISPPHDPYIFAAIPGTPALVSWSTGEVRFFIPEWPMPADCEKIAPP